MSTTGNTAEVELGLRPLTARSVLLSTLLGLDPPVLPASQLVATAGLFGIGEGTARVALSRMAAAGEVTGDGGRYRLAGRLLERQRRQSDWRVDPRTEWSGSWHVAVVASGRRPASERAELRSAMARGRLAAWRDGVWARPDNLAAPRLDPAQAARCTWLLAMPDGDPTALAAALWDLDAWAASAALLLARLEATGPALHGGDATALAAGFVLSAAVLRHLATDPLLPDPLLPPTWPGGDLRAAYAAWDGAYRSFLGHWHRARGEK